MSPAWWRARAVRSGQPRLLLIRVVDRHERPETVWADVASDDQEIARRNVRQEPVLIAEGNNSHADRRRQCRIVAQTSATTQNR